MTGVYQGGAPPQNLAVLLRPDDGSPERYRKRRLVPMVEWRPGDVAMGPEGPGVLGGAYGALICWEAVFPSEARRARRAGAELFVNVSNDAWFSASGAWGRAGAHQHAAHLVLRAVEHRVGAVRSANGGPSFVVAPTGRILLVGSGAGPNVTVAEVRSATGLTTYARTGDLAGAGSVVVAALLVWVGRLRRRVGRIR